MEELRGALVNFPALGDVIYDVLIEHIHTPHLLVDQWQVLNVLCGVLNHSLSQRPLFPELNIILHLTINFIFLCVDFSDELFQQIVKTNVDISIIVVLKKIRDQSMRNLRVKYEIANQVILAYQGRSILAEVVEDLHDLVGLHYLAESVYKRIYRH